MIHAVDHLFRLSQSPVVAVWAGRIGGSVAIVMLARLLVLAISPAQLPLVDGPAPISTMRAGPGPIANWHLFGVPASGMQVARTTLALTLRGTVDSTDPAVGAAIIAGHGQKDTAYHVGDALPGGGVLEAIHPGHVEIRNNGRRESLALAAKQSGAGTGLTSPAPSSVVASVPGNVAPGRVAAAPRPDGMTLLATQANVMPVLDNGRVVGARISSPDVALLEQVGLRRDDVITSVDGQAVGGPGFNQALESRLRAGGQVTLVVRRDGREQTVQVGH